MVSICQTIGICKMRPCGTDPGCFLKAMEIEGATPDETLIFEDSAVGIEAARRSGAAYFRVTL